MAFKENLRRLMQARSMIPAHLGPAVGVSPQAVSQWLSGRTMPVGKRLDRIAAALGVTVSDLTATANGFSDATAAHAFTVPEPTGITDDEFAQMQETVAAALKENSLPHSQADIARTVRIVERELLVLPRFVAFDQRLAMTIDETINKLRANWQRGFSRR